MKVKVKLFATLRQDRFSEQDFEFSEGSDVDSVLKMLNLERDDVPIIFINGRHADFNSVIKEKDEVALFPPVGGG